MPQLDEEEILSRFFGVIFGGILIGIIWIFKSLWRPLAFTGLWPLVILLVAAFANPTREWIDVLAMPIFFSFIFAIFWTIRSIFRYRKIARIHNKPINGVFFGIDSQTGRQVGKDIHQDGHILVVGGAGTGKSSSVVIPTLKSSWQGTFLAIDIKGELAEKSGREAHIFNPLDRSAPGYDPFYAVRQSTNPEASIREIALTLVPEPPNVKDPFWIQAAQNVLAGHLLFSYQKGASFFASLQKIQSVPPDRLLKVTATEENSGMYVTQYMGVRPETLASIMAQLSNHVIPFIGDPDIKSTLSKNKVITPDLLEAGGSIFLQIPEYKINQWKALITLILQQFLAHFERRREGTSRPILFMLDEFARFGKLEGIMNGLATLRSKKITICIIIQSLAQLDAIYGHEERKIITDNCAYKAVLGATDADTQEYFSKLVGTHEVEQISIQKENKLFFDEVKGHSISKAEKRVIRPEEFAYLEDIVLLTPFGPHRVQKCPYYAEG